MPPNKPQPTPLPTDDVLASVYHREKLTRPHWPQAFSEGMRDPLTARIVMLIARHQPWATPRGAQMPHQRGLEALDDSEHQREGYRPASAAPTDQGYTRRALDFKSRAAGEREDD